MCKPADAMNPYWMVLAVSTKHTHAAWRWFAPIATVTTCSLTGSGPTEPHI
ncbi:hypothetical protein DPMN_170764 [Dreissena polymorpha]|uniref:Uncharacterized protein n=1 Tax=Dreissena polymorpha TaxID=45954 RepID=A0A9D4DZ11_DREPO|nr:hypothetical protein DPMN_170764 [Dreissena polymorpha]